MKKLLLTTSSIACAWAMPVAAQVAEVPGSTVTGAQGAQQDSATSESTDQQTGIADIIVTASRREQSVQTSSLAIAVLGAESLEKAGISNPTELQTLIPGLTISPGAAALNTYIRGVGDFSTNAAAEAAIAYSINGVYISRPGGIGPIFYDLERVEVLKGPQGTLYGRNASGGAVNLITARPVNRLAADFKLDIGNYDLVRGSAMVNVPAGDDFAVRFAGQISRRDGYLSDGYSDQESEALRLTSRWEASDRVSLSSMAEYTHIGGMGEAPVLRALYTPVPEDPWEGPSIGNLQQPASALRGGTRITDEGTLDIQVYAFSTQLDIDLDFATLTVIPAYRNYKSDINSFTPGFRYDAHETSEQKTVEARLGNDASGFNWVVGGFYFDEDQTQNYTVYALPIQHNSVVTEHHTNSYAAFGETTFDVTKSLRLIAGLRYTHDRKLQDGFSQARVTSGPLVGSFTGPVISNFGEQTFEKINYRAGFEWDYGPQNMLFGTVATGYKSGGFVPSIPFPDNTYRPEEITAFTLGARNRFFDNAVQFNVEGFYWKYRDKHERFLGASSTGTTGLLTTNAGRATLYGFNVDLQYKPTRNDSLRFNVEYLHSRYDEFVYTVFNPQAGGYAAEATGCARGAITPVTTSPNPNDSLQSIDCSGQRLVRAPVWTGLASYERRFNLGGDREIIASASALFASEQWLTADFIDSAEDDGYVTFDASISYTTKQWSVQLWGRNLGNQAVYTGGFRDIFQSARASGQAGADASRYYASIRAPRTVGVTLRTGF